MCSGQLCSALSSRPAGLARFENFWLPSVIQAPDGIRECFAFTRERCILRCARAPGARKIRTAPVCHDPLSLRRAAGAALVDSGEFFNWRIARSSRERRASSEAILSSIKVSSVSHDSRATSSGSRYSLFWGRPRVPAGRRTLNSFNFVIPARYRIPFDPPLPADCVPPIPSELRSEIELAMSSRIHRVPDAASESAQFCQPNSTRRHRAPSGHSSYGSAESSVAAVRTPSRCEPETGFETASRAVVLPGSTSTRRGTRFHLATSQPAHTANRKRSEMRISMRPRLLLGD